MYINCCKFLKENLFSSIDNEAESSDEELHWESEEENDTIEKIDERGSFKSSNSVDGKQKSEIYVSANSITNEQPTTAEPPTVGYREYVDDDFDTSDEEVCITS